jgi:hypothetical protein
MKSIFFFCLIFLSPLVFSQKLLPSVEWQKKELKQQIESKVSEILMRVLKPNEFYVSARIDLAVPQMPNFNKSDEINKDSTKGDTNRVNQIKSSEASPRWAKKYTRYIDFA